MGAQAMMWRGLVCSVALALVACAVGSSMSTMPLFVWSGHSKVASLGQSVQTALSSNLAGAEIVMVYMLDGVSAHEMANRKAALTNLQGSMEKAQDSAFAGLPVHKVSSADVVAAAEKDAESTHSVKSTELQAFLANNAKLLSNGKPDVVVVQFPAKTDLASVDALVGAANEAVSAVTPKFVGILSSGNSLELGQTTNLATAAGDPWSPTSSTNGITANAAIFGGKLGVGIQYGPTSLLTPTLLVALLVGAWLLFVSLCAYCCILSLQTPEKFEDDHKKDMARALNQDNK